MSKAKNQKTLKCLKKGNNQGQTAKLWGVYINLIRKVR